MNNNYPSILCKYCNYTNYGTESNDFCECIDCNSAYKNCIEDNFTSVEIGLGNIPKMEELF